MRIAAVSLLAISTARSGDQPAYDVARIAPGLRVDAPAVIREDLTTFEILSRAEMTETHTTVYTIFRKEGRDFGEIALPYDRFDTIEELTGALYDEHGKEIRTLTNDDVKDESDINAYSLYTDARVRKAELYHDRYPYTVMYAYEIVSHGFVNFPSWVAQHSNEPVEHTRFEAILPASRALRYWISADSLKPRVMVENDRRKYVWEASGLKELSDEELDEDIEVRTAVVRTAPEEFEYAGHAGTMRDWKSFGTWCAGLYDGKIQLSPEAVHDVDSVVAGFNRPEEKARCLYRYMQEKTRYVNVTLGIGGYEPYDAAYVHQRGYGDCKALSNYMIAILARAGIKSMPAIVWAGGARSRTIESFPENRFNHVIVCALLGKDSIWLECTSQIEPFGHLGDFTENRPALLLTSEGGVLVRTPSSGPDRNALSLKGRIVLSGTGDARAEFTMERTGNLAESVRGVMTYSDTREKEEWILRNLDVSGTNLISHNVRGVTDHANRVHFSMRMEMPRFASSSGSRLFFLPDLDHRRGVSPKDLKVRKSPVRLSFAFTGTDSIIYVLPKGYGVEALPPAVKLEASFGVFRSSTVALGDTALLHLRFFEIENPVIPAAQYQEYRKFMKDVVRADKSQVVAASKQ